MPAMLMLPEHLPFFSTGVHISATVNRTANSTLGWAVVPLAAGNLSTGTLWKVQVEASSTHWGAQSPVMISSTVGSSPENLWKSSTLGVVLSLNRTLVPPPVQSLLEFVRSRYGPAFSAVDAVKTPPRKFPIVDSLNSGSGDSDPRTRAFLVQGLIDIGLSGLDGLSRDELREYGMPFTSGGIYDPPGCVPADGTTNDSALALWVNKTVPSLLKKRTLTYTKSRRSLCLTNLDGTSANMESTAGIRGSSMRGCTLHQRCARSGTPS